ncbi:MAG: hypothetical protein ACK2UF_07485, partial [Candidatus Promineifilaceae bacterium]
MKSRKIWTFLVLLSLITLFVVGCSAPADEPVAEVESAAETAEESVDESASEADAEPYEVAVVVKITGIPWFNRLEEGV